MAANRIPFVAPPALMSMSKATLADLVWEFAAYAAKSVDDFESRRRAIIEQAKFVHAPKADVRVGELLVGRTDRRV